MARFKIAFDVEAETLFGMMAKFLPIDNLMVEELTPPPNEPSMVAKGTPFKVPRIPPKPKRAKRFNNRLNLKEGINRVIMEMLEDGPHNAVELKKPLSNAGYSPNSVGSRLQNLEKHGIVKRLGDGKWKLLSQSLPPIGMSEVGPE